MATSITLNPQTVTSAQTTSAALPSFRQRCIEDLSPDKVSAMDRQSTLWTVAAAVTFVAFTAIAVGAFVTAGLLFPMYLPFVGLGALFAAMPVANFVKNFLEYSVNSKKEADTYRDIQSNYEDISKRAPIANQLDLSSRGIQWWTIPGMSLNRPDDLKALNPVLAKAQQLDEVVALHLSTRDELSSKASELAAANFEENRQQIYDLRNSALFAEDRALQTKIQAAFVNAVLRKGDYNGSLEDIATVSKIAYHERILGNELNQGGSVNNFITFNNRTIAPITHADMKRLSVAELGLRLTAAMA